MDELHANHIEQVAQRGLQGVGIGFVEAWADAQLWLRSQHADAHVAGLGLVEQASSAQGAPYTGKAGTDDQDMWGHVSAPLGGERASVVRWLPAE